MKLRLETKFAKKDRTLSCKPLRSILYVVDDNNGWSAVTLKQAVKMVEAGEVILPEKPIDDYYHHATKTMVRYVSMKDRIRLNDKKIKGANWLEMLEYWVKLSRVTWPKAGLKLEVS